MGFRSMVGALITRSRLANIAGRTFGGKRDLYKALGYKRELFPEDYRSRFKRNAVANRIVKALPKATWRGGAEIIEDEDPDTSTTFEQAFDDLNKRLKIWNAMQTADILAGLGRYAVILIGAPGRLEEPLERCNADEIQYLQPYSEEDAKIWKWEVDSQNERFGRPVMYTITRAALSSPDGVALNTNSLGRQVHWTRVIHVADGLLDDKVYGEPRLECIWNLIDDLEKVHGGGAEAFWKRADQGIQFDLDPTVEFDDEDDPNSTLAQSEGTRLPNQVKKQIEEYEHGLRRMLLTRGVKMNRMGSDVADFKSPVDSIISLISAGTGIPQRVLMGSEQAKLAAKMDRSNWDDRVTDRRDDLAGPMIVRPFVERLIGFGALPVPDNSDWEVRWSQLKVMDDEQRAEIAQEWSLLNQNAGERIVTPDEIRQNVLGLPPLSEVDAEPLPALAPKTLRKLACMSKEKRQAYLVRLRANTRPAPARTRQTLTVEAVSLGRRALARKPALREAIAQNDRSAMERMLDDAIDDIGAAIQTPAPVVAAVAPQKMDVHVPVTLAMPESKARTKRVEYEEIDGQMRPVRIIEE